MLTHQYIKVNYTVLISGFIELYNLQTEPHKGWTGQGQTYWVQFIQQSSSRAGETDDGFISSNAMSAFAMSQLRVRRYFLTYSPPSHILNSNHHKGYNILWWYTKTMVMTVSCY